MSKQDKKNDKKGIRRRSFLIGSGLAAAGAVAMPHIWVKNEAVAQNAERNVYKHLLYIRLSGGFRFTTAFNGDVADEFNPFGLPDGGVPDGVEWGPSRLLDRRDWLTPELEDLTMTMTGGAPPAPDAPAVGGLQPVTEIANEIAVIPCVDHEPLAGSADGNHNTGLERWLTGYVGGSNGLFSALNFGLRNRPLRDENGQVQLPSFVLGNTGMARGTGKYASYRPPVMSDGGFDQFGFDAAASLPDWARAMSDGLDLRMRDRQHVALRAQVDAYIQARGATKDYSAVFRDEALKIGNGGTDPVDGISNAQLEAIFGNSGAARNVRLALRLFHFGSPAVYLDQGGYDMHSGEESGLPGRLDELNRILAGLNYVLKLMEHPAGGTYWDHTVVVCGSEFGRTARGGRFNSARGSDHGGDNATRWMSMPFMGGPVSANGGRIVGASTNRGDLEAQGQVYSYRSVVKTLFYGLGAEDDPDFFPADEPFTEIWG